MVLSLAAGISIKPVHLVFDNFFTSYRLLKILEKNNIHAYGTVRPNRKGFPDQQMNNQSLARGESVTLSKGKITATKWMDNKQVSFMSNYHDPSIFEKTTRKNKDGSKSSVNCPSVVVDYNAKMMGVDLFDQLRERYAIGRRSRKWWHRIFDYLIDMCIVNSFVMYKLSRKGNEKCDQLSYRLVLAKQLIGGFTSRKKRGRAVLFMSNKRQVPEEVRISPQNPHFPVAGSYRRCRFCSTKVKEKRTRYTCEHCKVPLCIENCFKSFHSKKTSR